MRVRLFVSFLLPMLLGAGCGVGPVVWQKTLDIGGDERPTAITSDGTGYYVSFVATRPGGSGRAG